jgi:hypothetical protein
MSPPRITRTGSAFDRRLLRAARADEPPEGAEHRALAALMRQGAVPDGRPADAASALGWGKMAQVLGVGLAVAMGSALLIAADRDPPSSRRDPARAAIEGASAAGLLATGVQPAIESSAVSDEPPPVATRSPAGATAGSRPITASPPSSIATGQTATALAAEITIVQQAARALASGQPRTALELLEDYFRRFPAGVLAREAGVLRVRALARTGDTATAVQLARKLLDADPGGLLAQPLRDVIEGAGQGSPSGAAGGY